MKQLILVIFFLTGISTLFAQNNLSDLEFKFSGFVRSDFVYNTRQSVASLENLYYLYPKDHLFDEENKDLNAQPSSGFFAFMTRPVLDISGARIFNADVSAKIEADFGGASGVSTTLRIRLAYMKFDWKNSSLIIGQNWHPMFQNIQPGQLALATGAPFQPFNRSPQIRYDHRMQNITLRISAIYQQQNVSTGPIGKSNMYAKNAILPELNGIVEYNHSSIKAGVGINLLSLKPRNQSVIGDKIYKVDEELRSLSYIGYIQFSKQLFSVGLKSVYGQNNVNLNMLGGYGVKSINTVTGKCEYTNFNYSSSWLNLSYGNKYKSNLFFGFTKNLGTDDSLIEETPLYGEGLAIDNMYRLGGAFSYNVPHFSIGMEYEYITANYGNKDSFNWREGKYFSTHGITDHRITGVIRYIF